MRKKIGFSNGQPIKALGSNRVAQRCWIIALLAVCIWVVPVVADEIVEETVDVLPGQVVLAFDENTTLRTLIAYVSEKQNINIIYEKAQADRPITLRMPAAIPDEALLDLLLSVLSSQSLTLEDTPVPRTKRIVPIQRALPSQLVDEDSQDPWDASGVVTWVFVAKHTSVERLGAVVQPFLNKPGGNVALLPQQKMLIVTDAAPNVAKVMELMSRVDVPGQQVVVRMIQLKHSNAQTLMRIIQPMAQVQAGHKGQPSSILVANDARTNQLVLVGPAKEIDPLVEVVRSLDMPSSLVQQVYRPMSLGPEQLDQLITTSLGQNASESQYRSTVMEDLGLLIVHAPQQVHTQIDLMLKAIEKATPAAEAEPVRFYKLTNTRALDVLATIRSLEAGATPPTNSNAPPQLSPSPSTIVREPSLLNDVPPTPALAATPEDASLANATALGGALIAADVNTNSLIVIGSATEQALYEAIIRNLDQRRPQVLIETTIVTLDTTDNFVLGVDIGYQGALGGGGEVISFSSFGVSALNPVTGGLTPISAVGGTLALLNPNVADIVIQALATNNRSQLVSMPRILVNDNQTGSLDSVRSEPFEQTVVTDTSTSTSVGGESQVGTKIEVTPNISEGHYIQLEYAIELSDFTAQAKVNLPPPSQTNVISSRVTIPDGHTIIVGGLNRKDTTYAVNKIPLLGDIPFIGNLFKKTTDNVNDQTLFIFIRPTILRDAEFRDLKQLSVIDHQVAEISPDFPQSQSLIIDPSQPIQSFLAPQPPTPTLNAADEPLLDDAPESLPLPAP